MYRFFTFAIIVLFIIPNIFAKKKRPKTGEIKSGVYTDTKYDFKLDLPENWNAKTQKPKSNQRLYLSQKDHKIPDDLTTAKKFAKVPEAGVYIDEVTLKLGEFVDSLLSESYESDFKNDIFSKLDVLDENITFDGLRTDNRKSLKINGKSAVQWIGKAKYTFKFGAEVRTRSYRILCIAVKKDNLMLLLLARCEVQFSTEVFGELIKMSNSLIW